MKLNNSEFNQKVTLSRDCCVKIEIQYTGAILIDEVLTVFCSFLLHFRIHHQVAIYHSKIEFFNVLINVIRCDTFSVIAANKRLTELNVKKIEFSKVRTFLQHHHHCSRRLFSFSICADSPIAFKVCNR